MTNQTMKIDACIYQASNSAPDRDVKSQRYLHRLETFRRFEPRHRRDHCLRTSSDHGSAAAYIVPDVSAAATFHAAADTPGKRIAVKATSRRHRAGNIPTTKKTESRNTRTQGASEKGGAASSLSWWKTENPDKLQNPHSIFSHRSAGPSNIPSPHIFRLFDDYWGRAPPLKRLLGNVGIPGTVIVSQNTRLDFTK